MESNPLFKIRIIFGTLIFLVLGGTVLFHYLEPSFTWIQAFYFAVTTITTVGYGDLVPTNDLTRLAVSIYILFAVSLYVSLVTHFGAHYLEYTQRRVSSRGASGRTDATKNATDKSDR
jgi:hypothetical protein